MQWIYKQTSPQFRGEVLLCGTARVRSFTNKTTMKRILYVLGISFLLPTLFTLPARAQESPQIYITEINWAGSELSTADEWIELYNAGSTSVDVSGWVLTEAAPSRGALGIDEGVVIEPGDVLLVSNYPLGHEKTTLLVEPDLVTASVSIPNTSLHMQLQDLNGTVVDEAKFPSKHVAGSTNPVASAFRDLATDTWHTSTANYGLDSSTQLGTPGAIESLSVAPTTPDEEPLPEEEQEESEDSTVAPESELSLEEIALLCQNYIKQTNTNDEENVEVDEHNPQDEEEPVVEEDEDLEESTPEEKSVEPEETEEGIQYVHGALLINEFVSNPNTEDEEWIELFNPHDTTVELAGWYVRDASLKATVLPETTLSGYGFYIIEKPKGVLNNDTDVIELLAPDGTLIDSVTYGTDDVPAPKKGESVSRGTDGDWYVTSEPTKGGVNDNIVYATLLPEEQEEGEQEAETQDESEDEEEKMGLNNALNNSTKKLPTTAKNVTAIAKKIASPTVSLASAPKTSSATNHSQVTLTGVITAPPGLFGKQIAFMDSKQLFFYNAEWPELNIGDTVSITGTLSESRGEPRIKIASENDIQITGSSTLTARVIDHYSELSSVPEGTLVQISGTVHSRKGKDLTLEHAGTKTVVVAHENTGVSWSQIKATELEITGIVRHIDGTAKVYPRSLNDIQEPEMQIAATAETYESAGGITTKTTVSILPYVGGALATLTAGALGFWHLRYRDTQFTSPFKHSSSNAL